MTIKAIETRYKGYRFRSRLEARWAVFFDALGLQWEYEPEGFDLGEAGWYLPDFRVKLKNGKEMWVEVKPENTSCAVPPIRHQKRIYFAGKVGKNCWRHTIAENLRENTPLHSSPYENTPKPFYIDGHDVYTGPFFISCDHGCAHGAKMHGKGKAGCAEEETPSEMDDWQEFVMRSCLDQIDDSTHVFAWIDSLDCYGTLAEIGYAKAKGKKIYIAVDKNLTETPEYDYEDDGGGHCFTTGGRSEIWFVETMADVFLGSHKSARDAFSTAFTERLYPEDLKKISEVGKAHKSPWMLTNGDPLTGGHIIRYEGRALGSNVCKALSEPSGFPSSNKAARKARAARFEHGECG